MNVNHFLALAGLFCFSLTVHADEPKDGSSAKLDGTYRIISGERNGESIPSERLEIIKVIIGEKTITTFDKEEKQVYSASYKLGRETDKGQSIKMTAILTPYRAGKGTQTGGLIKVDDDTVSLIYALPGGMAPKEFETAKGQQMFVMKRVSD